MTMIVRNDCSGKKLGAENDKVICKIYLYNTPPVAQYCKPHCLNGILYIQREQERARESDRKKDREGEGKR